MTESWDDYADEWDSNPEVIAYADQAYASLCEAVDIDGLRVLDFGCGTGLLTEKIAGRVKEVIAIDTSEKMIEILQQKNLANVTAVAKELSSILIKENPIFAEPFDLVVASSVCSFLEDFEATLGLITTLLKPGGVFVQWDWLSSDENQDFGLSPDRLTNAYMGAGPTPSFIGEVFSMRGAEGDMPVLMGIGTI